MSELTAFLKEVMLFEDFSEEELESIERIIQRKAYKRNDVVFSEGSMAASLHIIKTGTIKITKKISESKKKTLLLLRPHDVFGEMALLDGGPRSASAFALESSEQYLIGEEAFAALIQSDASSALRILRKISRLLTERIRKTTENIKDLVIWGAGLDKTGENKSVEHVLQLNSDLRIVLLGDREIMGRFKGIREGASLRDIVLRDTSGNEFLIPVSSIAYVLKKEEKSKTSKYI